ncbi:MAG: penicillin-binding protein 2 [Frankiales bacterium]|nr:penicillin-binding protein 2 [Frankiales bacterium]
MIRSLRRLSLVLGVLLVALLANLTYLQYFAAADIRAQSGNSRVLLEEYSRERGPILLGSTAIASSIPTKDQLKYLRQYSNGALYAPATGFYSVVYGATGIERTEDAVLAGSDDRFFVDRVQQLFAGRGVRGGAVRLTLDPAAQKAAYDGLAGRTGAVAAIDPRTGAILALVSSPSFDPNKLSSHDVAGIRTAYNAYLKDPGQPMLNRPLVMTLPPGSTFKLVTAAAALESGRYTPSTVVPGPAKLKLPDTTRELNNWSGTACGPGNKTTLANALAISCNTAFASIGLDLGADAIRTQAEKFGFGTSFEVPLRAAASRFPADPDLPQTAMSAIGQYDVAATALQMAMVGAGIADNGQVMSPYLVSQTLSPDLAVLANAEPTPFAQAMSPANASALLGMMVGVVDHGTGSNARIPGVVVGGKTGTAQQAPGQPPHAWFVGVAPADRPGAAQVAVAVVLQNGGGAAEVSGNKLAAPIARAVMEAILTS